MLGSPPPGARGPGGHRSLHKTRGEPAPWEATAGRPTSRRPETCGWCPVPGRALQVGGLVPCAAAPPELFVPGEASVPRLPRLPGVRAILRKPPTTFISPLNAGLRCPSSECDDEATRPKALCQEGGGVVGDRGRAGAGAGQERAVQCIGSWGRASHGQGRTWRCIPLHCIALQGRAEQCTIEDANCSDTGWTLRPHSMAPAPNHHGNSGGSLLAQNFPIWTSAPSDAPPSPSPVHNRVHEIPHLRFEVEAEEAVAQHLRSVWRL